MFISIGWDQIVRTTDLVAIIDYQAAPEMLHAESLPETIDPASETIKSIVMTETEAFASPLTVQTLKKRADDFTASLNL